MSQPAASPNSVSTIDLWKALAISLMLIDHYGHFFATDETIWRALGRTCVPIWFFLIGYARTRGVPWTWVAAGVGLTALDFWGSSDTSDTYLNILLNFALIRFCLPWIERHVLVSRFRFVMFAAGLAAVEPFAGRVLEYGTVGALLAMTGLAHRHWLASAHTPEEQANWIVRLAIAAFGIIYFAYVEHQIHLFPLWQLLLMLSLMILFGIGLVLFRPGRHHQAPVLLAPALRFAGRYSLEIYSVHLAALLVYQGLPNT